MAEVAAVCSTKTVSASEKDVVQAVDSAAKVMGYTTVKPKQLEAILAFVSSNDVFVALPTGYGKSFCYGCLPLVFSALGKKEPIVIVVSPLVALMKDQVKSYTARGVSASLVSSANDELVLDGRFELVYISPEMLMTNSKYRCMCRSEVYKERLVALVVDEAHCVKKWGDEFRKEFSHLGELRSLLPRHVKIMALTATATKQLRKSVITILGMKKTSVVSVSPHRQNIIYSVVKFKSMEETFINMIFMLKTRRTNMPRTLIYCQRQDQCAQLYLLMRAIIGKESTHPPGSANLPKFRLFDCFTSATHPAVKDEILHAFTTPSPLRVVVATIAFGMGVDTPDIRHIVHWGPPEDVEQYVQGTGRGGRDGSTAHATLLCGAGLNKNISDKNMTNYSSNMSECRRHVLFAGFDSYRADSDVVNGCSCCDICSSKCECGSCTCNKQELFA